KRVSCPQEPACWEACSTGPAPDETQATVGRQIRKRRLGMTEGQVGRERYVNHVSKLNAHVGRYATLPRAFRSARGTETRRRSARAGERQRARKERRASTIARKNS